MATKAASIAVALISPDIMAEKMNHQAIPSTAGSAPAACDPSAGPAVRFRCTNDSFFYELTGNFKSSDLKRR